MHRLLTFLLLFFPAQQGLADTAEGDAGLRLELLVDQLEHEQAAIDNFSAADDSYDVVLGLSILHLVADRDAIIARVRRMLKPGGVFVSSTACLGDKLWFFRYIEPIGRRLGLMPMVKVFTTQELARSILSAGFSIEHQWTPPKGIAVFIIAKKTQ